MEQVVYRSLEVLLYSIFGYYFFMSIGQREHVMYGITSLFYALFCIVTIFLDVENVLALFLIGTFWGMLCNYVLCTIDKKLTVDVPCTIFGILNIANYYVLYPMFKIFIESSSYQSVTFLFVFGVSLALLDLSVSMRKLL